MKKKNKRIFRLLSAGLAMLMLFGMVACMSGPDPSSDPSKDPSEDPSKDPSSDPSKDPSGDQSTDPSVDPDNDPKADLPSVPSEREVTIVDGSVLHENTDELGRIPQGLTEVVNKYMTEYEEMNLNGAVTTFQTSTYSEAIQLPTDAVMAYFADKSAVKNIVGSWKKVSDKYELHVMTVMNRTNSTYEYLASDPSRMDQVMKDKNGDYLVHSGTTYYLMPNDEWTEYLWEMVELAMDTADIKTIVFEEPDLFKAAGYSDTFKEEWEKYYNEPWQDQSSSPEAMYKSQQLKFYLLNRMMTTIITRIREKSPDTKVYMATHSVISYNTNTIGNSGVSGLVAGTNQYLATGLYDGIIGQTWSDTSGYYMAQNGTTYQNRFFGGYLGYASYVDSAGDYDLFTLVDPVGDGIGKDGRNETYYYQAYLDTAVAQLIQPSINRFQVTVWPSRSFESATQDYRAIQLSVMAAQTEAAGKAAVQSAGTPGISYVLSETLTYPLNSNTTWAPSSTDSFLGVTLPLLSDGIPLTITAMENIKSADDLAGINLLLLSFDGQKPLDESVCEAIAEWIEQGGVCLYVGGHDAYDDIESMWWSSGSSPLQELLNIMGLDITVKDMTVSAEAHMDWLGKGKQIALEALNCATVYNNFYSSFEGDVNAILNLDGQVVGIDEAVGKGRLIAVGLPSALFANTAGGSEAMRKLAEYACNYSEYKYDSASLMWAKRGNVVAAYSIGQKNVLTGKYIDLFDSQLGVYTHYILGADESALLYDITDLKITDAPRVAFSGGELTIREESASVTKYNVVSTASATVASRIIAPEGLYPQSIHAENYKGNIQVETFTAWDNETHSLLVRFVGMTRGVNVTVEWGTTPVESYELQQAKGMENFAPILDQTAIDKLSQSGKALMTAFTTASGNSMDNEFIITNTAQSNSECFYCDLDREIVWCIDLKQYEDAYVTMTISQNYQLDVSTDGKNWTEIQNYIKVNGNSIKSGANIVVVGIDSGVYAKDADKMYLRLSNADPTTGYGGKITQYQIYYNAAFVPETDPADYAPLVSNLSQYDATYASLGKYSVLTNSSGADAEFIYIDRAQVNENVRYCDATKELFLKIDLTKYENAVVALQISQNYRVQVSANDRTYVTVQDWILQGHEWSRITTANKTYVILDSSVYANGSDAMYIKLSAADTTQGWGTALHSLTLYYNGEAVDQPTTPALPEISVEDYAPLVSTLDEYDAKYASRNKNEVPCNSEGRDLEFIYANKAQASGSCRYCDLAGEITLKFDLTKYHDAVIALQIAQNYRILVSFDNRDYVTVQDWILAGNEWGKITTANKTYVILDTVAYAENLTTFYVKIDNAGADDQGWGGAIHSITIYYTGDKVESEENSLVEEVKNYLPVKEDDSEWRAALTGTYANNETIIVNTDYPDSDAAFIVPGSDTSRINELVRFCDEDRSVTYAFDLAKYKDAVVMFKISNNYNVRVSKDGTTWTTVQNYVNANGGSRINSMGNKCWIKIDSADFAADAGKLYVRFSNCGETGGFGVAIYNFTIFYN